jgi:roadblock/LC7 domain-containing protein
VDGTLCFSPDGQRLAYKAADGIGQAVTSEFVVVDGKAQQRYTKVGAPVISPDGKRVAYWARSGSKEFLVLDGNEGPAFASVWPPVFSPDGSRVAYIAKLDKKRGVVVVDGVPGPAFEHPHEGPVFSADGRLAYAEASGHKLVINVNSQPYTEVPFQAGKVNGIHSIVFSPDGKRLAFVVLRGGVSYMQGETRRAKRTVVVDRKPEKDYNVPALTGPRFSPDGRHLAYAVHDPDKRQDFVVLDGQEGMPYGEVLQDSISFSTTAMRYWVRQGNKLLRVVQTLP